jgi:hypothetical protein
LANRVRRERSRVGDQRSCNSRGELRIIPLRRTRRASTARSPVHVEAVSATEGVLHRGARLLRGPEAHQAKPLHSARSPSRWRRSPSASGSGESRWVSSCSKRATHRWTSSRSMRASRAWRNAACESGAELVTNDAAIAAASSGSLSASSSSTSSADAREGCAADGRSSEVSDGESERPHTFTWAR